MKFRKKHSLEKRLAIGFSIIATLVLLAACQKAPETSVVRSKNDGLFEEIITDKTEQRVDGDEAIATDAFADTLNLEEFASSDDSVHYRFGFSFGAIEEEFPLVKVTPHYITEEEAKHVAQVLFGDVIFYDGSDNSKESLTQDEIRRKIQRWSAYTTPEAIRELLGKDDDHVASLVQAFLESYTQLEEDARNGERSICTWKYNTTDAGNNEIKANIVTEDASYRCWITVRDQPDFKLSNISVFLGEGASPGGIDGNIFRANLCRTAQPTQEQVSRVQASAEAMLHDMNLGEWVVDECYVETSYYEDIPEYVIRINAVPLLNHVAANRMPQLMNLKSEDEFSSNLYLSDVNFSFSPDGKLVGFNMYTPIDIQEVTNPCVQTLPLAELIRIAKQNLTLTDAGAFGVGLAKSFYEEDMTCNVEITGYSYGLSRINIPDTEDAYYYVPALVLKGMPEFKGQESGSTYSFVSDEMMLICLNAVDGTVINDAHFAGNAPGFFIG